MSDSETRQFFNPVPPQQSVTPGIGVTRLTTAVGATIIDLDAGPNPNMFGTRLTFTNEDSVAANFMWITFSSDGVTAVNGAAAPGATVALGTAKANGVKLLAGASVVFRLDRLAQRYLHVQSAAGTPTLAIYPSSEPRLS